MNWTGHVLVAPRSRIGEALKRVEATRTGIYFLVGVDPISLGRPEFILVKGTVSQIA
jgi:hypothetical protein